MKQPSEKFIKTFSVHSDPKTDRKYTVTVSGFRFSVLTSRLLRVEYSRAKHFTDEPTQAVLFRNIDKPLFTFKKDCNDVVIATKDTVFCYDLKAKKMKSITLKGGKVVTDFEKGNLKGTYRTLDMVNGSIPLEDGLLSRNGVSVVDDSKTVLINSDGTMKERPSCKDEYYFAYGNDYRGCIKDFYKLCGEVPLVPRYCLGNWWSRYKDYSQSEYLELMDKFIENEIPVSVATIDMDWHWVDVIKRFGKEDALYQREGLPIHNMLEIFQSQGWTGYSWNTELFPDYKAMLRQLQDEGFKVTLNLHPAQGVRPFEDMYDEMAKAMDIDPQSRKHIKFDITDPQFIEAYFDILHKPYEKDGVDFWWIDWQQEKTTKIKGLDPLWALNHYHTLAFNGEHKRPLILSRFAQVGSHRYPLGFS
ncbi:MAG: TIM-barrel domain-containing protein, partial [Acutalibacteraceae bacterium]